MKKDEKQPPIPSFIPQVFGKKTSKKKLRRFLKRTAERKGVSYSESIVSFYNLDSISDLKKNLLYSLHKK
jgi:hypothetical protein